jgi:hypothetical protein
LDFVGRRRDVVGHPLQHVIRVHAQRTHSEFFERSFSFNLLTIYKSDFEPMNHEPQENVFLPQCTMNKTTNATNLTNEQC